VRLHLELRPHVHTLFTHSRFIFSVQFSLYIYTAYSTESEHSVWTVTITHCGQGDASPAGASTLWMGKRLDYSSLQTDSKVKFAAWTTSWWPPGSDQLSLRRPKVYSRIWLCTVDDGTINMVLVLLLFIG